MSIAEATSTQDKRVTPRWMRWAGLVVSGLPSLLLSMGVYMNLSRSPMAMQGLVKYGMPVGVALPLGAALLASLLLYVTPYTAVLGAILLTGYLGGAVCTHVRAGEPFVMPIVVGVMVWGGLFLRDARIRALLPWRRLDR